jgi:hypothetical protein
MRDAGESGEAVDLSARDDDRKRVEDISVAPADLRRRNRNRDPALELRLPGLELLQVTGAVARSGSHRDRQRRPFQLDDDFDALTERRCAPARLSAAERAGEHKRRKKNETPLQG